MIILIVSLNIKVMLTLLLIAAGGLAAAVGTAYKLSDGKDHTSEMDEYERNHPYSSWEESQPYNP